MGDRGKKLPRGLWASQTRVLSREQETLSQTRWERRIDNRDCPLTSTCTPIYTMPAQEWEGPKGRNEGSRSKGKEMEPAARVNKPG